MNTSLESKLSILQDRAHMFTQVRHFFSERNILEVDCPALTQAAPIDAHIDVMQVMPQGYLHTSPEYGMKRLLALGIKDIYQLSHVFRQGEIGPLHNPEFTLIEWYRLGFSLEDLAQETLTLIRLFLGELPERTLSYKQAFLTYTALDYRTASLEELIACAHAHNLSLPPASRDWDKETLLDLLLSFVIEPHLGKHGLCILTDYPPAQAALAQVVYKEGEPVAQRFEVYHQGIELANGYQELTEPQEQKRRLETANQKRLSLGKAPLPIDEHFLKALSSGLPACSGVAVGFDRLMLLRHRKKSLKDILPFSWEEA